MDYTVPMINQLSLRKRFKHKKLIIVLLVLFLIIAVPAISVAAYAGFVPGLTEAMATNKPEDLGVRYTAADFAQIQNDTNHLTLNVTNFDSDTKNIASVTPGSTLVIYGANSTQFSLSQEELTAFVNMLPWTASPLKNTQIRLSNDDTLELSSNISAAYVSDLIRTLDPAHTNNQLNFAAGLANHLHNPAVYARMHISSASDGDPGHGTLHFTLLALKVNRMDLTDRVQNMQPITMRTGHGNNELGIPYSLSLLSISGGRMTYYGNAPAIFAVGDGDPGVICSHNHASSLLSLSPQNGHIGTVTTTCP